MAEWKKVVVSGSDAALNKLTVSSIEESSGLASPYAVVITGSGGELFFTSSDAIGGGGTTTHALTQGNGIVDFSFDGGSSGVTVAVSSSDSQATITINDSGIKVTDGGIDTTQLADEAVTFAKMDNAAANTVVVRDANSAGVLSAKAVADAEILIGKGNGFNTEVLSGDVTMTNGGVVSIATSLGALGVNSFTGSFTGSFSGDIPAGTLEELTPRPSKPGLDFNNGSATGYDGGTAVTIGINGLQDAAYAASTIRNAAFDASAGNFIYTGTEYDSTAKLTTIGTGFNSYKDVQLGPNDGTGTVTIPGDLVVSGTASFQNTQTLFVEDRYILLNSGSSAGDQGGIVIQTAGSQNVGQLFGYNDGESRWGINTSFSALETADFTANAFMGLTSASAAANPNTDITNTALAQNGNIYVSTGDNEIWIYA